MAFSKLKTTNRPTINRVIALILTVTVLWLIFPETLRADLSPEQIKDINKRRVEAQKRKVILKKEQGKRLEDHRKRLQQLRDERVKKEQKAQKYRMELKKMRDARKNERLKRQETIQADREKREKERRKANRERRFRP